MPFGSLTVLGDPAQGTTPPDDRPGDLVTGLEHDHVVAVEPAAIAEAARRGLNRLNVVLTRAVSRLDVAHGRALPREG